MIHRKDNECLWVSLYSRLNEELAQCRGVARDATLREVRGWLDQIQDAWLELRRREKEGDVARLNARIAGLSSNLEVRDDLEEVQQLEADLATGHLVDARGI